MENTADNYLWRQNFLVRKCQTEQTTQARGIFPVVTFDVLYKKK